MISGVLLILAIAMSTWGSVGYINGVPMEEWLYFLIGSIFLVLLAGQFREM